MILPGTSEQEVPGSVVPGVPGGTSGHTPESASQVGIVRPKKQGPDPRPWVSCPPKTGLVGSGFMTGAKLLALRRGEKASDEIRQLPSLIIIFVVPTSTAI
jgi:hypothetical protein